MVIGLAPFNVDSSRCESMPLTMNFSFFETAHLLEMREWDTSPDLVVHVTNHYKVPPSLMACAPKVLEDLTSPENAAGLPAEVYADDLESKAVLSRFVQDGLVEGPFFKLTLKGHKSIALGNRLLSSKLVVRRSSDLKEASRAQLILELEARGWYQVEVQNSTSRRKGCPSSVAE